MDYRLGINSLVFFIWRVIIIKIELDKYYTPIKLAEYCVNKTKEVIGENNISEYLEPAAGAGVFLNYLPDNTLAYDIEPEDNRIVKKDYLTLNLEYKKGRCTIGNPPFGTNTLVGQFYKKSIELGDYIAFILPISQLDNNYQLYKFDLIHSEDLGLKEYSGIKLNCCLNIYKRPENGELNKRPDYKLKDIELREYRRNVKKDAELFNAADIGICSYGSGIIGKIPNSLGQYVKETYFVIKNNSLKSKVLDLIKNTNWEKEVCNGISGQTNLSMWKIYKYIKEQVPEII